MKLLKIYFLFQLLVLLNACSSGNASGLTGIFKSGSETHEAADKSEVTEMKLTPAAFAAWVENKENGLKVDKTISDFTYTLQYKPLEYVALLELKKAEVSKAELAKTMEDFKGLQYFTFKISTDSQEELLKKNLKQTSDYNNRIQYFSFEMQKDLKLIDGKDTLNCELLHFERVFGLAPTATFVLGFPLSKGNHDKTLFYDEKIFGSGKIYLTIQAKNSNQLPAVITN